MLHAARAPAQTGVSVPHHPAVNVAQTLLSVLVQPGKLQLNPRYVSATPIHFSTTGGSYSDKRRRSDAGSISTIAIERYCARMNPASTARSRNDSSGA